MNAGKKFWKVFALALVVVLALGFATWETTSVQADINVNRAVGFPQVAHGLVVGEKIRTILVNRSTRPIGVQVSVFDADGAVVKQEEVDLRPGAMHASEVNCGDVLCPEPGPILLSVGDPRSKLLRTEVRLRLADVPFLFMASAVVDDATGRTRLSVDRLSSNHNETIVRDPVSMD